MPITRTAVHLTVGSAAEAAKWYPDALGAREVGRITLPDGRLIHLEMTFGDLTVMIADEFPEFDSRGPKALGGTYGAIYLSYRDVDQAWRRAVDAGASIVRPLTDTFWGERDGQVLDPFGHRWGMSQPMIDVPLDEMQRLAAAAFGEGGSHP